MLEADIKSLFKCSVLLSKVCIVRFKLLQAFFWIKNNGQEAMAKKSVSQKWYNLYHRQYNEYVYNVHI